MTVSKVEWNCNNYCTFLKGSNLVSMKCNKTFVTTEDLSDTPVFTTCPKCGEDLEFRESGSIID